jgi:hypothetical protein
MSARVAALAVAVLAWAMPAVAAACPGCLSTAFGDRSFIWPYLFLISLPLLVCAIILGVIVWYRRGSIHDPSPRTQTETT